LQQLIELIITHHQRTPDISEQQVPEHLATIIRRADSLAATERHSAPSSTLQLQHSIFSTLYPNEAPQTYQPLCSLTPGAYQFPTTSAPDPQQLQQQYLAHLQQMENELQALTQNGMLSKNRLLFFLRKYLWCIPAAYYMPDVSLYEHSKLTAALAVALYDYLQSHSDESIERSDTARYILAVGDLSGIQSYLYDISYKGAAKALKGRSFLLQLLTEIVAMDILEQLGYSLANLLYSGGGKFFLLLPNTEQVQQVLRAAREDTEQFFADEFDAVLVVGTRAADDGAAQRAIVTARDHAGIRVIGRAVGLRVRAGAQVQVLVQQVIRPVVGQGGGEGPAAAIGQVAEVGLAEGEVGRATSNPRAGSWCPLPPHSRSDWRNPPGPPAGW